MPTLLIIDSNTIFRRTLKDIIQRRFSGLEIAEAEDSREGLEKGIHGRPQMVITDLSLKGGAGLSMIQSIASQNTDARIVVLTDMDEEEYRMAAIERGADDFISKSKQASYKVLAIIEKQLFN
ncbi:MAG: response regulator transcription factor [Desulfobacteraceae bacterium]|nr:response regulator transcription factor [Desulfobacteraceae bacterium]